MADYLWTRHSLYKLQQYGLSEQRVKRVIRAPFRTEEGIVKNTIAVMQPVSEKTVDGKKTWKQEIWAMYAVPAKNRKILAESQRKERKIRVISAWRYPGVSPKNDPIPEAILQEIRRAVY